MAAADTFVSHVLDMRPPIAEIYGRTHKSTIQRKILRAERESLTYRSGNSDVFLDSFYRLLVQTRKRHGLPPQPIQWFRNLVATCRQYLTIRLAAKNERSIAAMLTLNWHDTMVYKYGCSDARYHNLGAVPFLFWKAIQEGKSLGIQTFDLGRSDLENTGLITFKERLGAIPSKLTYVRYGDTESFRCRRNRAMLFAKYAFGRMPDQLLAISGNMLYRHIG